MSIRRRSARGIIALGLTGALLAGSGLVAANPAAAGPKQAELIFTPEYFPINSNDDDCGLRLTADYTGGKGKYTLTYQLTYIKGDTTSTAGPVTTTIRRSSGATIIQANTMPQGPDNNTAIEYVGELTDNKGNLVDSFGPETFPLVNC